MTVGVGIEVGDGLRAGLDMGVGVAEVGAGSTITVAWATLIGLLSWYA